jgi:hypothetical protein
MNHIGLSRMIKFQSSNIQYFWLPNMFFRRRHVGVFSGASCRHNDTITCIPVTYGHKISAIHTFPHHRQCFGLHTVGSQRLKWQQWTLQRSRDCICHSLKEIMIAPRHVHARGKAIKVIERGTRKTMLRNTQTKRELLAVDRIVSTFVIDNHHRHVKKIYATQNRHRFTESLLESDIIFSFTLETDVSFFTLKRRPLHIYSSFNSSSSTSIVPSVVIDLNGTAILLLVLLFIVMHIYNE